jgi:hypothetical protein
MRGHHQRRLGAVWPNGAFIAWLPLPADSVMQFGSWRIARAVSATRSVIRWQRAAPRLPMARSGSDSTSLHRAAAFGGRPMNIGGAATEERKSACWRTAR